MSLKVFHLIFITLADLLCWGFGFWCLMAAPEKATVGYRALGASALLVAVALVIYEFNFVRKLKNAGGDKK